MSTPTKLSKAERVVIGGAVAPIVRRQAEVKPRAITVLGKDGKPARKVDVSDVAQAVLARSDIEFSVQEGKRPEWVTCKTCERPIRVKPQGNIPARCLRNTGCFVQKKRQVLSVGAVFHSLTVVSRLPKSSRYECACVCGNSAVVKGKSLTSGHVKSCGCLRREMAKRRFLALSQLIDFRGEKLSMAEIARRAGITAQCIQYRMDNGMTLEAAVDKPSARKKQSSAAAA